MYYLHMGYRPLRIDYSHQNSSRTCGFEIVTSSDLTEYLEHIIFVNFIQFCYLTIIECTILSIDVCILSLESYLLQHLPVFLV